MKQDDLINEIASTTQSSKSEVKRVLDGLTTAVHKAVKNGDEVTLIGIGKVSVTAKPARQGRNPRTGEAVEIAAKNAPKFTAAKALKDAANS